MSAAKTISATLEIDEDGTIIISDNIFFKYGAGDTPKEALNAYIENLTVYYEILEESISDEYPENEEFLDFMKEYILPGGITFSDEFLSTLSAQLSGHQDKQEKQS